MFISNAFLTLKISETVVYSTIKVQIKMYLCCIKQGRNVIKTTKLLTQTLLHAIAQHSRVQKQGFSDSSKSAACGTTRIRKDKNVTQAHTLVS